MGSPLGREVAPREMSVALATPLSGCLKLSLAQKRVVLACASGAGLAAVYNVPLAAAVFVLETLLLVWELPMLLAALITCGTAVLVVRVGLGDMVQYANIAPLVQANISAAMLVWALVAGVAIGLGVNAFAWCNGKLPKVSRTKPVIIVVAVLAFAVIGVLSMWFPEIFGQWQGRQSNGFCGADFVARGIGFVGEQMGGSFAGDCGWGVWRSDYAVYDVGGDDCVCFGGVVECAAA